MIESGKIAKTVLICIVLIRRILWAQCDDDESLMIEKSERAVTLSVTVAA